MIPCKHWRNCGVTGGGCCAIGVYNRPSFGVCLSACTKYDGPERPPNMARQLARGIPIPLHQKPRHAQILVNAPPTTAYIGDRIANGLAKLGVKTCPGCNKRKSAINRADKKLGVSDGIRRVFSRA